MKSPHDPENKIRHAEIVYECQTCGKQFEYLTQAKNHQRERGKRTERGWTVPSHRPTAVERGGR